MYLDSFVSSESDNSSDSFGYGLFANNSKTFDMTSTLKMTVGRWGGGWGARERGRGGVSEKERERERERERQREREGDRRIGIGRREKERERENKGIFFHYYYFPYVPPQSSTEFSMAHGPLGSSISFSMGTPIANTRTGSGYTWKHTQA
jgi:hypothetical protein